MPTINGKACVANGRNLISGSYDSSWWAASNGDATIQKVTMDSGEVALHVISTDYGGFWTKFDLPSGDCTVSVDVKGTGKIDAIGWENISSAGMTPTNDWQRVSRTGSLDGEAPAFICYGKMDVYVRLLKVEKGSVATPLTPAPVDKVFSNGVQVYGRNFLIDSDFVKSPTAWTTNGAALDTSGGFAKITGLGTLNNRIYSNVNVFDKITVNSTYSISFLAYSDTDGTTVGLGALNNQKSFSLSTVPKEYTNLYVREKWDSYALSIVVPKDSSVVYISKIKVSLGSIATPWTPAPEDVM